MKKYSQFLKELPSNTVVFAFGRFNPPTTGHELLVKAVKKLAVANKADHAIYASKSQDAKKNPLTVEKKVHYLKLMFPNTNFVAANPTERTFIEAAKALNKKYKNLIMVAGSDRIPEYERILNTYNGKDFHYDTVQVISAGERDPDADDATGMSASKMRAVATKGDYSQFKKGLPSTMREIDGRRLMNDVRQGMGLEPIKEQLNLVKDDLREQYFRGEIFNIGDMVESAGVQYEIVKRGSNHLLLKEESGKLVSKWLQDVTVVGEELKLEESMIPEELTDKTIKPQDKIKVARIIATMLGVDNAETSGNPDQLVNLALRKVRTKTLNPEALSILNKMLELAREVGINIDTTAIPTKLKESEVINKASTYNAAKDRLRLKDYVKLNAMSKGEIPEQAHDINEPGSSLETTGDEDLRRMKVKKIKEESLNEISKELAGNYYAKVTQQHIKKVGGVRHNMYDRLEKDLGKKRKQGMDRAFNRITKEELVVEGAYEKAEENKRSADAAKKQGDMFAHHLHMADHHDNMAQWHSEKGRHGEADRHAEKSEQHHEKAMSLKEDTALQESMADSWKKVQSMDKGSVLQGKEGARKRLAYLQAVHAHHKKYGNDTKKVKKEIEGINRSRLAEEDKLKDACWTGYEAIGMKEKDGKKVPNCVPVKEEAKVCPVCGEEECTCNKDEAQLGAHNAKGFDPFVAEEVETVDLSDYETDYDNNVGTENEISDEELEAMADEVDDIDDIIDVYDDEELAIVDDETGEEIEHDEVNESALMEVLSRMERMKAKIRIARSKAKRERSTKIALRTYSGTEKINKRARRLAIKLMKKRLLRGRDPAKVSIGEKERIERTIEKRKKVIGRLAMRLAPRVKQIEKARMSHKKFTKGAPNVGI